MADIAQKYPVNVRDGISRSGEAQRSALVLRGVGAFNSTDATGTLPVPLFNRVEHLELTPLDTPATIKENIQIPLGSVSATAAFTFSFPKAGTVTAVTVGDKDAISGDDTNFWTFGIVNKGAGGGGTAKVIDSTVLANSTKATGGSGLGAYTPRALTLGAAADLIVAAGDLAELTITKAAAAVTMTEMHLRVTVDVGGTDETLFFNANSDGTITITSGKITIKRTGNIKTSGLKFAFTVTGR